MTTDCQRGEAKSVKTEDGLECTECDWNGLESDCQEHEMPDDWWYECPVCGAECSYWPLDELGDDIR